MPITSLHIDEPLRRPPLALLDGGHAGVSLAEPEAGQPRAVPGHGETADVAGPAGRGGHREDRLQLEHGGVEPLECLWGRVGG